MDKKRLSEQVERNKPLITKDESAKKNPEPSPQPVLPDKKPRTPEKIKLNV